MAEASSEATSSSVGDGVEIVDDGTSSEESEKDEQDSQERVASICDVLRAPKLSTLNRKRKTLSNRGQRLRGGKRRHSSSSTRSDSEPRSVTPLQRVREFAGEQLVIRSSKLFCNACREELSLKSSSIKNHVRSSKHVEGKQKLARREAREQDIATALRAHNAEEHLVGEHLPEAQQVFRVKVVTAFLRSGVPLNKLHYFREPFEEGGYRLTDRHSLSDLVPFVQKREKDQVSSEITGRKISVIFDGTCRLGEALCLVVRYVSDNWAIEQRLVALKMLQKSLTGEEIARAVISTLSIDFQVSPTSLLACMRDRAATNNIALRTLKVLYPNIVNVGCFSHTIDHVGEKFDTPVFAEFVSGWISLFAHSPKNKALWLERTGRSMKSFSATRWWSRWEVMEQLLVLFGDVEPFCSAKRLDLLPRCPNSMVFCQIPTRRCTSRWSLRL